MRVEITVRRAASCDRPQACLEQLGSVVAMSNHQHQQSIAAMPPWTAVRGCKHINIAFKKSRPGQRVALYRLWERAKPSFMPAGATGQLCELTTLSRCCTNIVCKAPPCMSRRSEGHFPSARLLGRSHTSEYAAANHAGQHPNCKLHNFHSNPTPVQSAKHQGARG